MSSPAASPSQLLATIESDLAAGASYLEQEALGVGLELWNLLKGVFVALEPAAAGVLVTTLKSAVATAGTGASIESIETAALNAAETTAKTVLETAGSGVIQTIIAALVAVA
jgi:hypothetical protein